MNANVSDPTSISDMIQSILGQVEALRRELAQVGDARVKGRIQEHIDRMVSQLASRQAQAKSQLEAQAQAEALYRQTSDAIMTIAPPSWKFTGCNKAALRLFEVDSESDFIQFCPWDISPEVQSDGTPSGKKAPAMIERALHSGSHYFEWDHKTITGKVIPCMVLLSRIHPNDHMYLQAVVRDISGFKEQQLLSDEIQRMAHIGGWELDAKTGTTRWTPETYCIHAIAEETPTDKIMGIEFYAPQDRDRIARYVEECLKGVPYQDSFEFIDAHGQQKWVEVMGKPLCDVDGNVYKVVGTFQDISDKVASTKDLKKLALDNVRDRSWIENSNDAIWEINQHGITLSANRATARMLKCDSTELVGRSFFDFMDPEERQLAQEKLSQRAAGIAETHEWRMIDANGFDIWLNISAVPCLDSNGTLLSVVAFCSDITHIKRREAELRKSSHAIVKLNAQLKEAQETAQIGSWSFQLASGALEWSDELFRIFDIDLRTPRSELHQQYLSRIHPEDRNQLTQSIKRAIDEGIAYEIVHRIVRLDGEIRFVRGTGAVRKDSSGRYLSGLAQDITTFKLAEVEARRQSETLERFFNVAQDLLCIAGTDARFKKVNQAFIQLLGYSEEELLSQEFLNFVHPDDLKATLAEVEKLATGTPTIRFENRYRTKAGDYRILSWTTTPDPEAGILYASARDVTDQRASQKHTQAILNALDQSAIIAYTDATGKIKQVNDNFCRISGFSRNELIGHDHRIINSGKHSKEFFRVLWSTIRKGELWTGDIENKTKDGEHYFVRTVISPLRAVDGTIDKFISIRFDITQQKRAERQAEQRRIESMQAARLVSLGEMAAGIAHEINNPLAIIAGAARALSKFSENPEQLHMRIECIQKSTERITRIVTSLKKYSRKSQNNLHAVYSVGRIIDEAIILTQNKSNRHSVPVNVLIESNGFILCDEVEIEQVLINLISNGIDAVKNLNQRWVQVCLQESNDQVILQVRDSGSRIGKEVEAQMFQAFFTTKAAGEGTGLGLSIAKRILDEHHASIQLVPEEEHTCFEVRFEKAKEKKNAA